MKRHTEAKMMLEVTNVTKSYSDESGRLDVLKDVSLSIQRGELAALIGISGAGKTTLLQILGGLDRPTSGSVTVNGAVLHGMSAREAARYRNTGVGFVFQFHQLLPDFTALENTVIPGLIAGRSSQECRQRGMDLLDTVGLAQRHHHLPAELSGGERQRVALARALFNEPSLILADEPTGNLDQENGAMLLKLFRKANRDLGQTILVATHNPGLTEGMRRIIRIHDGRILADNISVQPDCIIKE